MADTETVGVTSGAFVGATAGVSAGASAGKSAGGSAEACRRVLRGVKLVASAPKGLPLYCLGEGDMRQMAYMVSTRVFFVTTMGTSHVPPLFFIFILFISFISCSIGILQKIKSENKL